MVPLNKALVNFDKLPLVTMLLSAAVWLQFATQVNRGAKESLRYIGSYVSGHVYIWEQVTKCSKNHNWAVMDADVCMIIYCVY